MNNKNISRNTIIIGSDHAGFRLKENIKEILTKNGFSYIDMGNKKFVPGDDYPDYARSVAIKVSGAGSRGIEYQGDSVLELRRPKGTDEEEDDEY